MCYRKKKLVNVFLESKIISAKNFEGILFLTLPSQFFSRARISSMSAYAASRLTSLPAAHATWLLSLAKLHLLLPYIMRALPHQLQNNE